MRPATSADGLTNGPFAAYQARIAALRRSPYMDFPAHVHLETFAKCNASCSFCPSEKLERSGARMPDSLIAKILAELTAIPVRFQLSPFKVNEPFLDVRLFDILELCNRSLPNAGVTLTTNASPLTDAQLKKLAALRNIGSLFISVNERNPEAYERVMGIPFARSVDRLKSIHRVVTEGKLQFPVILSRVGDGSAEDQCFTRWAQENFPRFQSAVFSRGGWLGQVDTTTSYVPAIGCIRWFDLSITATGVVAHCCMDGMALYPIGDANRQHLLEIYNSPAYRSLREHALSRLEAAPCKSCGFL